MGWVRDLKSRIEVVQKEEQIRFKRMSCDGESQIKEEVAGRTNRCSCWKRDLDEGRRDGRGEREERA